VRHGYPWVPTDQAHGRPRQVGPAYQKTRRPVGGPNRPSWRPTRPPEDFPKDSPDDLVHHDLKTWRTRQDKTLVDFDQSRSTRYGKSCNQLDLGFRVVTDLDSGPPTLSVAQYKAGKGVPRDVHRRPPPPEIEAIQTEELDVGFYSPEARTSIKSLCPCVSSLFPCATLA
jgi:hypothetical protein